MIDPTGVFDNPKYAKLAFDNSKNFKNAEPFPHIHFDNFLSNDIALELSAENSERPSAYHGSHSSGHSSKGGHNSTTAKVERPLKKNKK